MQRPSSQYATHASARIYDLQLHGKAYAGYISCMHKSKEVLIMLLKTHIMHHRQMHAEVLFALSTRVSRTTYSSVSLGRPMQAHISCAGDARRATTAAPAEQHYLAPDWARLGHEILIFCTHSTAFNTYTRPRHDARKLQVIVLGDVQFVHQHVMHGLQIEAFFHLRIWYEENVNSHHH